MIVLYNIKLRILNFESKNESRKLLIKSFMVGAVVSLLLSDHKVPSFDQV